MHKRHLKVLLLFGLILSQAGLVQAAGFNLYEAGVRATALGGAFTASADDGSAIFYNAAGLSFQDGAAMSLNFMPVNPRFKFAGATTMNGDGPNAEAASRSYLIPGTYYTNNNDDRYAFGVGVYAPFGLGVEWLDPQTFVGRFVSYDVDIQTIYVTPAVSIKLRDNLAVAIGADVATQSLSLERITPHPIHGTNALDTHISGNSKLNITPSFGLMYKPSDKFSLGFMYHHEKTMEYEDQNTTIKNLIPAGAEGYEYGANLLAGLNNGSPTQAIAPLISSELNLPYMMSFGAAWQMSEKMRLEANYVHFNWSTFENLAMDFEIDDLDQEIVFNYEDSWQARVGLDYEAIADKLNLMFGYVHDQTPQPLSSVSPLLPDSDRNDFSGGLRLRQGNWEFGGCYMAVLSDGGTTIENGEPTNHNPTYPVGTYKSIAHIFGASVGYHF